MKENKEIFLREILEQMSTEQLDEMLHSELRKNPVNGSAVRMILSVLKEREADQPVEMAPEVCEAWEQYKESTSRPVKEPIWQGRRLLKVASMAAVLFVLIAAISQTAEAESFWGRISRWTDSIFELFAPGEEKESAEYVFETDHPGLQEVYDTLVELGVTEPVVPTWLPEGNRLTELKIKETASKTKVHASFGPHSNDTVLVYSVYDVNVPIEYHKDDTEVELVEIGGSTHSIIRNNGLFVTIWIKDNVECSISIDCQEDELYNILKSIYTLEVN
ncbi:MAG: DUF4367 domain-containing protein [Oscillospiraceae bacterium]|nr:DUF4367 domain-containing protein [Oscillospiraceae bacterium]